MTVPTKASPGPRTRNRSGSAASEISPGVYVGGSQDALRFDGAKFCVRDDPTERPADATHIPVYDPSTDRAIPANLERLAREIARARARGDPVLVFCGHGIRRGPLGVAWYLRRAEGLSLAAAYARVRVARPTIEEARVWIRDTSNLDSD